MAVPDYFDLNDNQAMMLIYRLYPPCDWRVYFEGRKRQQHARRTIRRRRHPKLKAVRKRRANQRRRRFGRL